MIKLQAGEYLGTYRVHEFLGRGGFAYVYRAEDPQGRKVALKVGDVAGGGRFVTRFTELTEAAAPAWLRPAAPPGGGHSAGPRRARVLRGARSAPIAWGRRRPR